MAVSLLALDVVHPDKLEVIERLRKFYYVCEILGFFVYKNSLLLELISCEAWDG